MRMRTIFSLLFFAIVAAVAGRYFGSIASGSKPDATKKLDQLLIIKDGRDSFGEVWETSDFSWSFPIVNLSNKPVKVINVNGSCTCMSVSPQSFLIESGSTQIIEVVVDFKVVKRIDDNAAFSISYQTEDTLGEPSRSGKWIITGKVKPFIKLDQHINFGRFSIADQPAKTLIVSLHFGESVDVVNATVPNNSFKAEVLQNNSLDNCRLSLTPLSTFPLGPISANVILSLRTINGNIRTEQLPITGLVVTDIQATPPMYPGGPRVIGDEFEYQVTISSLTAQPFTIISVNAIGEGLTAQHQGDTVGIHQKCLSLGKQSGQIEILVLTMSKEIIVRAVVDYTGYDR